MNSLFLNNVSLFGLTEATLLFYIIIGVAIIFIFAGLALAYIYCRPLLPVRVNCWFCNNNLWVPFADRNCFDCRICSQYNGFTSEGDYNKDIIPEAVCAERESQDGGRSNGLCLTCNINQQLKIQQLACFVPLNENNYDAEIDSYRKKLEKAYCLCDECSLVLTQTLQSQHYDLLTRRLNGHCPSGTPLPIPHHSATLRFITSLLSVTSSTASFIVLFMSSITYFNESQWMIFLPLLDGEVSTLLQLSTVIGSTSRLLSFFGARNLGRKHILQISLWGIMLSLSYTMHLYTLISFSSIYILSNLAWNESFARKPSQQPPNQLVSNPPITPKMPEPAVMNSIVPSNSVKVPKAIFAKIDPNAPSEAVQNSAVVAKASEPASPGVVTRSQKIKQDALKVDVVPQDKTKKQRSTHRSQSPPLELYRGMTALRLGSPEPDVIPGKPANFLFEKLNFDQAKGRKSVSILRPSQFNMETPSIRKESFSPKIISSTPSSDGIFSDLDGTAVSPLHCVGNYTPPPPPMAYTCNYDYPFSTGMAFCPPVGQATMYAYSRPSPYPYSFSPAPPYDCPMSPQSDGASSLSQSSSCNATQPAHNYRDWVKTAAHVISVGVNVVVFVFMILPYLRN